MQKNHHKNDYIYFNLLSVNACKWTQVHRYFNNSFYFNAIDEVLTTVIVTPLMRYSEEVFLPILERMTRMLTKGVDSSVR